MDFFDERILTLLKDGKPRGFTALLNEARASTAKKQERTARLKSAPKS
jgi:hypothetical protein